MLFGDVIIGPIHSRRLGTSLGINLLPLQRKLCSFDCIYCECGWNKESVQNEIKLPTVSEINSLLGKKISELVSQNVSIDSFTFAGNGEPTLYPEFPQIVDMVIKMRNTYYPSAKITVLSNATQLSKPEIFEALRKVDNPVLKLDAGTASMYKHINKPNGEYNDYVKLVENLIRFGNQGIIQTLLLRGENEGTVMSNVSDEEFSAYIELLKKIRPKYVMLYAIDRATPEKKLEKLSVNELEIYAEKIRNEGIEVQVFG